ncbi:MAG: aminotransferase class IV [Saprospiraceae bacterium]
MLPLCWINGTLTFEPHLSAHDRGLLVADGLFETIRVERGEVVDFSAHFARLSGGLQAFDLTIKYTEHDLLAAAHQLLERVPLDNTLGRLRLTVTRGVPGKGSTVFMTLVPQKNPTAPLALVLTDVIRIAGNPTSKYKTLAYTDNFYAQRQVAKENENRIAVLCNQWGRVACGSIGNVFVKHEGVWLTPSVSEGVLPGITRGKLLAAGTYLGLPVIEGEITVDAFLEGEALLTNVLRGVERGICALHRRSVVGR